MTLNTEPNHYADENMLADIRPDIKNLKTRLSAKRAALRNSDVAINALSDLIVAAANGNAQTESGARLSMADATKGASELRQVHQLLAAEIAELEAALLKAKRCEQAERGHSELLTKMKKLALTL